MITDDMKVNTETFRYMREHNITNIADLTEADVDAIYQAAGVERVRVVE